MSEPSLPPVPPRLVFDMLGRRVYDDQGRRLEDVPRDPRAEMARCELCRPERRP